MKLTHDQHEANRVRNMAREQAQIIAAARRDPEQIVSVTISETVVRDIYTPIGDGLARRTGIVWERTELVGRLCDVLAAGYEYRPSICMRGVLTLENCPDLAAMGDPTRLEKQVYTYQTGTK